FLVFFFFQAKVGIRHRNVTGVQTCALPISVFVQALPAKELMNVDFPTLGIPTTMARTGRFLIPLLRSLSIFSRHASSTAPLTAFSPVPRWEFTFNTRNPLDWK